MLVAYVTKFQHFLKYERTQWLKHQHLRRIDT